jgi:DNA-binding MarR family transcriptional regulator
MAKLNPGSFLMIPATCLDACKTGSINSGDIAVLAALAKFTDNKTRVCWPSITKLCEITGISRPTVAKALGRLTQVGLIQTVALPNHGNGKATKRRLVFSEPSKSEKLQETQINNDSIQECAVIDRVEGRKYLERIKKNIRM